MREPFITFLRESVVREVVSEFDFSVVRSRRTMFLFSLSLLVRGRLLLVVARRSSRLLSDVEAWWSELADDDLLADEDDEDVEGLLADVDVEGLFVDVEGLLVDVEGLLVDVEGLLVDGLLVDGFPVDAEPLMSASSSLLWLTVTFPVPFC